MWGGYPVGRSGKRHCGGGEEQSQQNPGSSAGGAGQEELLRGKKDVQIQRKRDAGFSRSEQSLLAWGQTGVTNRSLTTDRVQPQGPCTQTKVGGRIEKQRTQRGKGEAEEGLDFFAFKRFYSQ